MALTERQIRAIQRIEVMDDAMVQILRSKTPAERFAIADRLWGKVRDMIRDQLRTEHPEWTEQQVQQGAADKIMTGDHPYHDMKADLSAG
jgi:hypothetical protein